MVTATRNGGEKPPRSGSGGKAQGANGSARKASARKPNSAEADRAAAKQAKVKRRHRAAQAQPAPAEIPAAPEGSLLTTGQMREARKIIREKQIAFSDERYAEAIVGWSGIEGDDRKPFEYSAAALTMLLDNDFVRRAIDTAYNDAVTLDKARVKN